MHHSVTLMNFGRNGSGNRDRTKISTVMRGTTKIHEEVPDHLMMKKTSPTGGRTLMNFGTLQNKRARESRSQRSGLGINSRGW